MVSKTETVIEDLYRIDGQAEIVNGKIVRLPFHNWPVAIAIGNLLVNLRPYAEAHELGHALGSTVAYVVDLPHRKAFCPDLALTTSKLTSGFPEGAPIFVAEFRDPRDFGLKADKRFAEKRADYFAAGTQVVWDVDVLREGVVRVYRATDPNSPTIYQRGEVAEAEPAVPGWTIPVDDLFA
jgi:Uma2 family endonuclease